MDQTNRYAEKKLRNKILTKREESYHDLTLLELEEYLGVLIMMGIDKKPDLNMHWQTHGMWTSNLIKDTMSRDRFKMINKFLCVGDESEHDKLNRIRNLSCQIQNNSSKYYCPRKKLAIDESMIAFKGNHSLKQYLPIKPTKWGFKVFLLCESITGYCIKHKFFSGKNQPEFKPKNICIKLANGFENQNFHIYMDNLYTSVDLFEEFYEKGIKCTGIIRKTKKKLPDVANLTKDKSFTLQFLKRNQLTLALWKDHKIVCMGSTYYSNEFIYHKKWRNGNQAQIQIPLMIKEYNTYMKGVDIFDQRLTYYSYPHKFKKWWKYIFIYLLEISMFNSFIIYNKFQEFKRGKQLEYLQFRLKLAIEFTKFEVNQEKEEAISYAPVHHHSLIKRVARKDCRICKENGKKSSPPYECNICKQFMHESCFNIRYA